MQPILMADEVFGPEPAWLSRMGQRCDLPAGAVSLYACIMQAG